ncbi:hypothetical protein AYO21_04493 [Fonsecaea monophora]|uniref:Alpha/beta hydrolase fold-3 domain-containing protein n=1 Tax=Fonsecaea monophora TaxID=254056 RepID=A0A177FCJ8_9EURO|nr:hypothetical protein AYO21_04493 [Fonsecaea monophora]OAG41330.1 hypothetical protein AYO21_04493 [Fonsecaea monophora]
METVAQSEDLSRYILAVLLTWIFAEDNAFDLSCRPAFGVITPWNITQTQMFINAHFAGRNLRWVEVWQQAYHLGKLLEDAGYENSDSKLWTIHFNWLMNAAIIYLCAVSRTVTRDFHRPRALPVGVMTQFIGRLFNIPFTIQDLEYHITHWVTVLSGCAGKVQANPNASAAKLEWTLAKYLTVPLSPLMPNISRQLCGPYRRFHEEVVQWYPPRVWRNRLTPMSPYQTSSTDIVFNVDAYTSDHDLPCGLRVRQFVPRRNERRDLPVLVWFAGGGWMLGDISGDNNVLSQIAVADWVRNRVGRRNIIIAGVSSGGNLAAATALTWSAQGRPPAGLLLIAPSLDNTWDCEERWRGNWDAPWLTPATMQFFQNRCFQGPRDRSRENWRASPIYANQRIIEATRAFPTKVVAMGGDILCQESIDFVARLEAARCPTTLSIFPYGHTGLLMQGIVGTALIEEMIQWIKRRTNSPASGVSQSW